MSIGGTSPVDEQLRPFFNHKTLDVKLIPSYLCRFAMKVLMTWDQ